MKVLFNCIDVKNRSGGIARTAKIVENYLNKKNYSVLLNSLNGFDKRLIKSKKTFSSNNSKILFSIRNNILQLFSEKVIYYHPALVRSHLFTSKQYLSFIFGIDVWNIKNYSRLKLIKNANSIFSCSRFTISKMEGIFQEKITNAQCIWPGTDTDKIPKKEQIRTDKKFNILIVGRIVNSLKGHDILIDTFKKLIRSFNNLRLIIVGEGEYKKKLEINVKNNNLNDHILFTGFVNETEMESIWSSADLFVMPSKTEGFGLVYIEAMRHSIPVICSNEDAGCEINEDGYSGFNINLNNKDELTTKIAELINDNEMRAKMGINANTLWKEKFNLTAYEKRLEKFLIPKLIDS